MSVAADQRRRARLRVEGTVQGVGFRPHVYRLAHRLGLAGFVLNDSRGVLIEVEGSASDVAEFLDSLRTQAPPLAVVERIVCDEREPLSEREFRIVESSREGMPNAAVTPDTATCADCVRELFDPSDRRYRYPFINCTNCGPRFTIVRGIPYDRPFTTMARFRMCASCQAEYDDPADRRFHAQPNACPACGPSVSLRDLTGRRLDVDDPIRAAAGELLAGRILAVKGIGGYHLACRADDEVAVIALRSRKHREDKPFALMVRDIVQAQRLVVLGERERDLLSAPQRPIVVAARRADAPVASAVAPGAPELGVMLPYSPLHHLLLEDAATPIVLTSGNVSDEPIAFRDDDALARLAGIAELFLVHDRPIQTRTDDSVARVVDGRVTFLRRSRGYVPASIPLPVAGAARPLLACGAELKSTFCVARDGRAWVSHHIGDLENYETLRSFTDGIAHFERLFDVEPQVVAHDLHPEYLSSKYARDRDDVELIGVQHHHAHLAACLAEHGEPGPAIGAIFDGTGYGTDGTIWGGEILAGDVRRFDRVGHLMQVPLPGGERAIRQPWRMALSWMRAAGAPLDAPAGAERRTWERVRAMVEADIACPLTSSMGRLFDAVGALCGVRSTVNYEGQAAIELEAVCDPFERGSYAMELTASLEIDPRPAILALLRDLDTGSPVGAIATRFHRAVADATVAACTRAASESGTGLVVLCGGVFMNRLLLGWTARALSAAGLRVLTAQRLPPNDGGISYGQAAVAAASVR